jgi:hypothetical protein
MLGAHLLTASSNLPLKRANLKGSEEGNVCAQTFDTLSPRQVHLLQGAVTRHELACHRSVSIPQKSAREKKFFGSFVLYDASVPLANSTMRAV